MAAAWPLMRLRPLFLSARCAISASTPILAARSWWSVWAVKNCSPRACCRPAVFPSSRVARPVTRPIRSACKTSTMSGSCPCSTALCKAPGRTWSGSMPGVAKPCRPAPWWWVCNVAAATPSRVSRPTRQLALQQTCWCGPARPSCSAKTPRCETPRTNSPSALPRRR